MGVWRCKEQSTAMRMIYVVDYFSGFYATVRRGPQRDWEILHQNSNCILVTHGNGEVFPHRKTTKVVRDKGEGSASGNSNTHSFPSNLHYY